ncbi:hypothetical protein [uncultured Flavonifractor sp.]|nr:hypothetical protein [uncultured Flavonifractor sp.]
MQQIIRLASLGQDEGTASCHVLRTDTRWYPAFVPDKTKEGHSL